MFVNGMKKLFTFKEEYHTALSMFLLKKGDWTIPKHNMTRLFNQKSLEYIYEKVRYLISLDRYGKLK